MEDFSTESWMALALKGRCPRCGRGDLFSGYLKVASHCRVCQLDFTASDSGDGPAVFVMFPVGFIVVAVLFALQATLNPPLWLLLSVVFALTIGLSLVLLRIFKAALIILQFRNDAKEGRSE